MAGATGGEPPRPPLVFAFDREGFPHNRTIPGGRPRVFEPKEAALASQDRGTKREDPETGRKFYDLNRDPIVSPYTGKSYPRSYFEQSAVTRKAGRAEEDEDEDEVEVEDAASAAPDEPEVISLEDADAEEAGEGEDIPDVEDVEDVEDIGETMPTCSSRKTRKKRKTRLRRGQRRRALSAEPGARFSRLRRRKGSTRQHPRFGRFPAVAFPGRNGAIAQLGERLNGIQKVVGSIPIGSTSPLLPH